VVVALGGRQSNVAVEERTWAQAVVDHDNGVSSVAERVLKAKPLQRRKALSDLLLVSAFRLLSFSAFALPSQPLLLLLLLPLLVAARRLPTAAAAPTPTPTPSTTSPPITTLQLPLLLVLKLPVAASVAALLLLSLLLSPLLPLHSLLFVLTRALHGAADNAHG
jgi:hypothetical protein